MFKFKHGIIYYEALEKKKFTDIGKARANQRLDEILCCRKQADVSVILTSISEHNHAKSCQIKG